MSTKKNQKQTSIEEYIATYCQEKRIRERYAVYVSPETHRKLKRIARLFHSKHYTTTSSLVDSIISRHFEVYRELLDKEQQQEARRFLDWLNNIGQHQNDEPEE